MVRRPQRPLQLALPRTAGWGGRRKGAGRPRTARPSVPHVARPPHKRRHPVHVTLRAKRGLPYFRRQAVASLVRRVLEKQTTRPYEKTFQVVHFSIQDDHLHLIVEADDDALRTGVSGFVISFARRLNRMLDREGGVRRLGGSLPSTRPHHSARGASRAQLRLQQPLEARGARDRASARPWGRGSLFVCAALPRLGATDRRLRRHRAVAAPTRAHLAPRAGMAKAWSTRPQARPIGAAGRARTPLRSTT
jgi:REP element-mobilizing transposase RayT